MCTDKMSCCGDEVMSLSELFGSNVFNDKVMRERLPKETYKALKQTIEKNVPLMPEVAAVVANAMKDWAIEARCHPLHSLVSAADRLHRREARLLHYPHHRRRGDHGVFRQAADPGRAGCLLLPKRRPAGDLRGPRLYRLGLHLAGLP